jgi:SAM-dependent methyltransferase
MRASRHLNSAFAAVWTSLIVASGFTQALHAQALPQLGQPGKDVLWVPTAQSLVERMLDMAKVTPKDYVIDLGSGDGRLVIAAARRGARAVGIEYNPDLIKIAESNAAREGVSDKTSFIERDLFQADLSRATVITMFLLPELNLKLRPRVLDLKPGTRVVSNTFTMGEWLADETAAVSDNCTKWCTALLWVVPAKVAGTWRLSDGTLTLKQEFQLLSGTFNSRDVTLKITSGIARGDQIRFNVAQTRYRGRVDGDTINGLMDIDGIERKWRATRSGTPGDGLKSNH